MRDRALVLVKPQTYMNSSGAPLRIVASWYKVPPEELLVVSDDLDLPFGKLRMRRSGSSGGHNGLKSVIAHFGGNFPRLRVGIGRDGESEAIGRVLGRFSEMEQRVLPSIVAAGADGIERWLDAGTEAAMQFVNAWTLPEPA